MSSDNYTKIDPMAPRFGQAITGTLLAIGIGLSQPIMIYAVAVILTVSVISRWKLDLYSYLWRNIGVQLIGGTGEMEAASPHRFSKLMGMAFTFIASIALISGFTLVGYLLSAMVMALALLAASTGFCLGCRMYRQTRFFQKLDVI